MAEVRSVFSLLLLESSKLVKNTFQMHLLRDSTF